jgi:hypothetical protein
MQLADLPACMPTSVHACTPATHPPARVHTFYMIPRALEKHDLLLKILQSKKIELFN